MAVNTRTISADSHVNPPNTFCQDYIPVQYRDRAPKTIVKDGYQVMTFEGQERKVSLLSASAGKRYQDYKTVARADEEGRRGGFDPHARATDMDVDGVDAEVLYGNALGGGTGLMPTDRGLRFALMQAYNTWLADYCKAYPQRLVGIAEIPHWDLQLAIGEATRAKKLGLRGVIIPAIPTLNDADGRPYIDPWYEPLWSALEDLGMPVNMHLGARPLTRGLEANLFAAICSNKAVMTEPITSFIFAGVFDRHPKQNIVSVESGIGWMAFLVPWMDNVYERHRYHTGLTLKDKPSAEFQEHVAGTFIEDEVGVRERHVIGVRSIMWSSDYPHSDSTWPHSRKAIEEHFKGVPEEEKALIVGGNAARLYGV